MNRIITIGREFGSGGREFGHRLATALHFAYYDREIIIAISKRTSLAEEYLDRMDEQRPTAFFPITIGHSFSKTPLQMPTPSMDVQREQAKIIREAAENSDCVIVGRCADYILQEKDPLRLFIYADKESKLERCRKRSEGNIPDKELIKQIQRVNKARASYYGFCTGRSWGDKNNYDICLNTSRCDLAALDYEKFGRTLLQFADGE